MRQSDARELAEIAAAVGRLGDAADEELVVELGIIGHDILGVQRELAPQGETGALRAALAVKVLVEQMRVRIGLLNQRLSPFYGRIVNFGRHAQTVYVQRRRRVNGLLRIRRGRKIAEDIAAAYPLHVRARDPVRFIDPPELDLQTYGAQQLADYLARTFQRAGVE